MDEGRRLAARMGDAVAKLVAGHLVTHWSERGEEFVRGVLEACNRDPDAWACGPLPTAADFTTEFGVQFGASEELCGSFLRLSRGTTITLMSAHLLAIWDRHGSGVAQALLDQYADGSVLISTRPKAVGELDES